MVKKVFECRSIIEPFVKGNFIVSYNVYKMFVYNSRITVCFFEWNMGM